MTKLKEYATNMIKLKELLKRLLEVQGDVARINEL
jgi:hypothetical protein